MSGFETLIVLVFGLCFGSFANVCIYRMPRELSIAKPSTSFCPKCKKSINWYDNIPVLSFLFLKGKCRNCKEKISFIYPSMELLCGILFLSMYFLFGFSYVLIPFCLLVFCLMVATAVDFEFQIIPDEISFFLMAAGLLMSFFNTFLGDAVWQRILNSVLGFFAGGGSLFFVAVIGKIIFKKDAMGGGDIKIMAGAGAFLGWDRVLFAIAIACFLGSIVGIILILTKKLARQQAMPFGPYLAAGTYITLFLQEPAVMINSVMVFEEKILSEFIFGVS